MQITGSVSENLTDSDLESHWFISAKIFFTVELSNQLIFTDCINEKYFSPINQLYFTEVIREIWLIYSNLFSYSNQSNFTDNQ